MGEEYEIPKRHLSPGVGLIMDLYAHDKGKPSYLGAINDKKASKKQKIFAALVYPTYAAATTAMLITGISMGIAEGIKGLEKLLS